jgi:Gametolysin peptidase M11
VRRARFVLAVLGLSLALAPIGKSLRPLSEIGTPILGAQSVLVVLATWGPEPFARDDVERVVFGQADAFIRTSSYGRAWLTGTVTPWLHAFDAPFGCVLPPIARTATAAARAAGYDPRAYERLIYVHPAAGCPWSGVTFDTSVWLNGALSRKLVAHELGHTFGLSHANSTLCVHSNCDALEYGDPYDTMGRGFGDFSANGKFRVGWVTRVGRPRANGVYRLDALERPSSEPQALVVTTAKDEYWIENRSEAARTETGEEVAGAGVLVHVGPSPDVHGLHVNYLKNVLVVDPANLGRPELRRGDRFSDPGVFTLTLLPPSGSRARLSFKWTDGIPPTAPRIGSGAGANVDGSLLFNWKAARDDGSGLAYYNVTLDGRAPVRVPLGGAAESVLLAKPPAGKHRLALTAVDRAGNRSAAAVARFRVR